MKRCVALLVALLTGLSLLAGCDGSSTEVPQAAGEVQAAPGDDTIVAEAVVEPVRVSVLGFRSVGEVVEVLVEEGDTVEAGQVLIRLDDTEVRMSVQQAEAGLQSAQSQLALLQTGPRPEEIAAAEAQLDSLQALVAQASAQQNQVAAGATGAEVAAAQADVAAAATRQRIARDAHDSTMRCQTVTMPDGSTSEVCPGLGTQEEQARYNLQAADEALAAAQARLNLLLGGPDENQLAAARANVWSASEQRNNAQAQMDLLIAGARPEEIAIGEAAVTQAEAQLAAAQARMADMEVRAPFDGTIADLHVELGNAVLPGQSAACVLASLDRLQVRTTDLTELDVAHIRTGQPVTVTVDALPGQVFAGEVQRIALQGSDFRGDVVYAVTVALLDTVDAPLRWGMTAWVEFEPAP